MSPAKNEPGLDPVQPAPARPAAGVVEGFRLANGLTVVAIPDRRAPVVTHMVWYRNGSADDPPGKSGIAHFLEHLMFKGTATHPQGEFSKRIAEIGGQENAFTGNDYTAYFQRVAKEHLGELMAFEADRMTGLKLTDEVVTPERDVVLEERRMHCDADPSAQLNEAVQATLFAHHPYGTPIIGWAHEIETLDRADALAYYGRFYTPENAILVVAGDIDPQEVRALAERHYGPVRPRGDAPERRRPKEPLAAARRLVVVNDEKVEQPSWQRCYVAPSHRTAAPGESPALDVLAHLLGGGQTSLLYRKLVLEEHKAVAAGAYYMGDAFDDTRFYLYAIPVPGASLPELDAAVDRVLGAFVETGVAPAELERAKTRLVAEAIYAQDSQFALARWYGASLATGQTIEDVQCWPERIEAVSADDVVAAARKWLDRRRAVTGYLLPPDQPEAA
ncbi:MAG: insulinase family protein [Bradyrhizobium sp.]|nr:MAG: insulinase family protein [Bradyrhizobium sp.]